jgi:hypothetical protein
MLGSALIATQGYEGTAIVAQDLETQEDFIKSLAIDKPIRTIRNIPLPYKPAQMDHGKLFWRPSFKDYTGEKPETTYVIVPKGANRDDYDALSPYGEMADAYHYLYYRTNEIIFIHLK